MGKPRKNDAMDGAQLPTGKRPSDFYADPETGIRPGENRKPWATVLVDLRSGIAHKTLPPRTIWKLGKYAGENGDDFQTWVVSGEGTNGNYETRKYIIPREEATKQRPRHPADWPKAWREDGVWGSYGARTSSSSSSSSYGKSSSLPYGLRIRCVGCGHWFGESDLKNHVTSCCPASQGGTTDWAIECDCGSTCKGLDDTVKVKPGFPRKPPVAESKPDEQVKAQTKEGETVGSSHATS